MSVTIATAVTDPTRLPPGELLALLGMILDGRPLSPRERADFVLEVVRLRWREAQRQGVAPPRNPPRRDTADDERGTAG
jgi:hypothetical protein